MVFSAIGAQYNTVFYRLCEIILATGKWYKHVDHRDVYLAPGSKNIDNSTIQKIAKQHVKLRLLSQRDHIANYNFAYRKRQLKKLEAV